MKRTVKKQDSYRFERCEVRLGSREVMLDGQLQQVEPRPFDLLVYLIEHRDRVIPKDELLDKLWPDDFVSPSVVSRAIMKARQAIGDSGKVARLIKTVHSTGYHFIGELAAQEADVPPPKGAPKSAPTSVPSQQSRVPLVLLPFENLTGQAELDWVELGLMSMVAKALSADTRLRLPELASLLSTLDAVPAQAPAQERIDAAERLLGTRNVVHVTVSSMETQYAIDYGISTHPGHKRLLGTELTQLGQRLAAELQALLFTADAMAPVGYESADPLVNQALARALQATGEQKWQTAVNLFKVVLDIEPPNTDAQLEYLRALAFLGNEAAFAVGERLLAHAGATNDHRLAIAAHDALATTYNNRLSQQATRHARQHLNEALRLAGEAGLTRERKSTLRTLMGIAIHEYDFVLARQCLDEMERLQDPDESVVEHVRFLGSSGVAATTMGDPQRGLQIFRTVAGLAEAHGLQDLLAITLVNIIYPCVDLGLMHEATTHGEKSLATAQALRNTRVAIAATAGLCRLYRERKAPQQMRRVLAQTERLETPVPVLRALLLLARGHQAACEGAHGSAVERMNQALAIYRESEALLYVHDFMPWLVISLVLSGRADAAEATCAEARALPNFDNDPVLHAALRYCDALIAHTRGQRDEARSCLTEVASTAPTGLWRARARLDGAWLAIEAGDLDSAHALLQRLGPWLLEHPAGALVEARFKCASGEFAAARAALQRYAESIESPLPDYHAELVRYCDESEAAALRGQPSPTAIAPSPRLPTVL
jgi:DNA-binding winged helix-turn-helix (wHTH) protein